VLLQDYSDIEYIIIDGKSTDASIDIIRKYERFLSYWVSERDGGQADAINKGFAKATGDIVAWLNSDDYYEPGAIDLVAREFLKDPSVSFIYGKMNLVDEINIKTGEWIASEFDLALTMTGVNFIPQTAAFWKKSVVDKVGLLDTVMDFSFDMDYWMRIGREYRLKHIPATLADFRVWGGQKTSSMERFRWETLYACEKIPFGDLPRPKRQTKEYRRKIGWAFMGTAHRRSMLGISWMVIRHLLTAFIWDPQTWVSKVFFEILWRTLKYTPGSPAFRSTLPRCFSSSGRSRKQA
jgi:glycosyltransferase involved in cell wall biosynthesis